ncbi:MAG: hypothetical protein U0136_09775 [Bdellovibrionota bacterium]
METHSGEQSLPFTQLVEASIETVTCVREGDDQYRLLVRGWLVYFMGPLQRIYFGIPGSPLVEAKRYAREDIAQHFGSYEDALLSGFEVELPLTCLPTPPVAIYSRLLLMNNLSIVAVFEGPTEIPVFDKTTGRNEPPIRPAEQKPSAREIVRVGNELQKLELKAFLLSGRTIDFEPGERPKISAVLPSLMNAADTHAALQGIHSATRKQAEVILLRAGHDAETLTLLQRINGASVVPSASGFASIDQLQAASTKARGDYLLFLNEGTVITDECVDAAVHTFESQARVGAVAGRLLSPDGCVVEAGSIIWQDGRLTPYSAGALARSPDVMFAREVESASSAFLLTPRRLFESFGGFDAAFSKEGYAVADYCVRLRDGGYRVMYEPRATATIARSQPLDSEMIAAERRTFLIKHGNYLTTRIPFDPQRTAEARHARLSSWRLLSVCTSAPLDRRLRAMLEALVSEGCQVTFVSLWSVGERENNLPPPTGVEIFDGGDPMFLRTLIESRPGYYTGLWIPQGQSVHLLRELQQSAPRLLEDIRVLSGASVQAPIFPAEGNTVSDALLSEEFLPKSIRDKLRAIE